MDSKIFKTAVFLATAAFFASCQREDVLVPENLTYRTLTAEMAGSEEALQTRTCVDVRNPNTGFIGLLWQPEDQIGVYSQNGNSRNAIFKCTATQKAPQAEFGGEMSGTPYYAYYPYSADNDGCEITALKGNLPAEQAFDPTTGSLVCDYKYGIRTSDEANTFNFKQLFTMLRVTLNAGGTGLEGERLNSITISVTDANGNARPICGDFTFNATDGTWKAGSNTAGTISMPWTTRPELTDGKTHLGFITVMPVVKVGDKISIEVTSEGHKASFTADCKVDFNAGYVYDIPLTLKEYKDNNKFGYTEETIDRPSIESFIFEVAKNSGKLLDNKLVWNSSSHTPSFSSVSSYAAAVNDDTGEITLTIPYLYDFKLKPTFSVSGSGTAVKVNGDEQESGVTEVDFTQPVIYTVISNEGATREYTVRITNTGLPVVVINQSTSGDFSKDYKDFWAQLTGSPYNEFVDFMIRAKDTDWVEDDQITVYNSDGSVNLETTLCGVRLRGNTTQEYPKKPFAIKLATKKSVLGMPEHKRWVLLANWLDHSMIRNSVAFDIAQAVEYAWRNSGGAIGDGIPWNVHGQNVELVFIENGEAHHVGNYYLCEQIKIDGNRLAIRDSYEDVIKGNASPSLADCGYLLEFDSKDDTDPYFNTGNGIKVKFKDDKINGTALFDEVKAKIQGIEDMMDAGNYTAAYEQLDINSVIDQWLIWELTFNREYGDPGSVYMYMDGDGKLCAGPVWDFDRGTFQNQERAEELGNSERIKPDNEWMCWRSAETYIWYKQLIKDPTFQEAVQKRWAVIRPYLDMVADQIGYYGQTQAVSYTFDSAMWPTDKADITEHKSGFEDWSGDEQLGADGNYQEVINNFKTVYQERLAGMDALITSGTFTK